MSECDYLGVLPCETSFLPRGVPDHSRFEAQASDSGILTSSALMLEWISQRLAAGEVGIPPFAVTKSFNHVAQEVHIVWKKVLSIFSMFKAGRHANQPSITLPFRSCE